MGETWFHWRIGRMPNVREERTYSFSTRVQGNHREYCQAESSQRSLRSYLYSGVEENERFGDRLKTKVPVAISSKEARTCACEVPDLNHSSGSKCHMEILSRLLLSSDFDGQQSSTTLTQKQQFQNEIESLDRPSELAPFVALANTNHVIIRALHRMKTLAIQSGQTAVVNWCDAPLTTEQSRINSALRNLETICSTLQARGFRVAVIKSLDHWPDLGSDLDLCTIADEGHLQEVMRQEFHARPVEQSWGDRLANKWNYSVPGLSELVEIHVGCLGQTGEHSLLARRVLDRAVSRTVGGHTFQVAAPEEQIIISALQRVYRHFYFRLCDMVDISSLLRTQTVDFDELHRASESAGIWRGVLTFLFLVQKYVTSYGGQVFLPDQLISSASASNIDVCFENDFLRVPKATGAVLYAAQLLHAGSRCDIRSLIRLPLLPPLAVSAWLKHEMVGNDKGIW